MNKEEFNKVFADSMSTFDILKWLVDEMKENKLSQRTICKLVKEMYKK